MAEKYVVLAVLCGAALLAYAGWVRYARGRYLDSFVFPDALRCSPGEGSSGYCASHIGCSSCGGGDSSCGGGGCGGD